jgi:flagellar hook-associated protein 2
MVTPAIGSNAYTSGNQATPSAAVYARVEREMATRNTGATKLNTSLQRDQTRLSALGQLQNALAGFQSLAQGLAGNGLSSSATSSVKGVQASAGAKAVGGSYAVDVRQLAQKQVLVSGAQQSGSAKIGTGAVAVLKIEFGTTDGSSFSAAAGKTARSLTIDSSNNTLDGIAAALKAAGVGAQVVKTGAGFALSVSGESGAANSLRISAAGDAAVKNLLAYNPAGGKNLTQVSAAQDALLTVDGKQVKSASNTVGGAIGGVTLELSAKGAAKVVVAQDADQIAGNVANLVGAYNKLNGQLQSLQKGELKSDLALGQVSNALPQVLGGRDNVAALAKAGIVVGKNGDLQLDQAKLKSAIAADPDAVGKLFTNDGKGLADQFAQKIAALSGDDGVLHKEVATVGKEIATLNGKKAVLTKALTAQATALVNLYAQQEQAGGVGALPGYSGKSLFDFLA